MSIKDITSWAEEFEVGTRYGDHTLIIQIGTLLRIIGDAVSNICQGEKGKEHFFNVRIVFVLILSNLSL